MKKIGFLSTAFLLVFAACKKTDLPGPKPADPVFYLDCTLDGQVFRREAGNEGYEMHASFSQDANRMYVYKGELKPTCCDYGFTVLINDYKVSQLNGPSDIDSAVRQGKYRFQDQIILPTQQNVMFLPSFVAGDDNDSFNWTITDGTTTINASQTYSLEKTLDIGKTYTATLQFDDGVGGCTTQLFNVFTVGNAFQSTLTAESASLSLTYNFGAETDKLGAYSYAWSFGDGTFSSATKPTHTYASDGTYLVSLTMKNGTNDSCKRYYQVNAGGADICTANFSTFFKPTVMQTVFKNITVQLTDLTGSVYSSAGITQPVSSEIDILTVSRYDNDKTGQPTKSVILRFNCLVSDGNKTKVLSGATAKIAIAYKQ